MPLPILIIQPAADDGPAYFGQWLAQQGIPFERIALFAGEPLPGNLDAYAGVGVLGGYMSANDPLPWIEDVLMLLRLALQQRIPVIGHCLGGQLLARAAGGSVTDNPVPEIGWVTIEPAPGETRAFEDWLGANAPLSVFQWHYQTFAIPENGRWLAQGQHCRHQAFVVDDLHLGMQFHCEVDHPKVSRWLSTSADEIRDAANSPAVQPLAEIAATLNQHLPASQQLASRIYRRWAQGLR